VTGSPSIKLARSSAEPSCGLPRPTTSAGSPVTRTATFVRPAASRERGSSSAPRPAMTLSLLTLSANSREPPTASPHPSAAKLRHAFKEAFRYLRNRKFVTGDKFAPECTNHRTESDAQPPDADLRRLGAVRLSEHGRHNFHPSGNSSARCCAELRSTRRCRRPMTKFLRLNECVFLTGEKLQPLAS